MGVEVLDPIEKYKLLQCFQCATCSGSCPVSIKSSFNVRKLLLQAVLRGWETVDKGEEIWSCTTCSTCTNRCPREVNPMETVIDLRGVVIERGRVPPTIRDALESIYKHGNPWGGVRNKRSAWMGEQKIKNIAEGEEANLLYFVCCTAAYDPRIQEVARSLVKVFNEAKVDFGILGNEENCCGNEVYGMGEKGLFEMLVEDNLKLFNDHKISRIVTTSPHCYNAFKNRYGTTNFEVQHYTHYIADLLNNGKLSLQKKIEKKVTYHDPCYLGKHNKTYEEPRMIIENIPGIKFVELDRSRDRSLCCEGGGGRMWVEFPGQRLSETRVKDAFEAGAEVLLTACPFCLLTLEDAVKMTGKEGQIKIMDITELLAQAV